MILKRIQCHCTQLANALTPGFMRQASCYRTTAQSAPTRDVECEIRERTAQVLDLTQLAEVSMQWSGHLFLFGFGSFRIPKSPHRLRTASPTQTHLDPHRGHFKYQQLISCLILTALATSTIISKLTTLSSTRISVEIWPAIYMAKPLALSTLVSVLRNPAFASSQKIPASLRMRTGRSTRSKSTRCRSLRPTSVLGRQQANHRCILHGTTLAWVGRAVVVDQEFLLRLSRRRHLQCPLHHMQDLILLTAITSQHGNWPRMNRSRMALGQKVESAHSWVKPCSGRVVDRH
jgi:hypothetical protein